MEGREEYPGEGMRSQSDEDIALRFQRGDERAFDELVRRFQGKVFATAYRIAGNREDALDVSQEVFLKVHRKIDTWEARGGGLLPWLVRLTANQAIDLLRRRKRFRHVPLEEAIAAEGGGAAFSRTEQQVRAGEIDVRVRRALARLSESQRNVFMLRHYEGLPLADIAEALGCTTGSVKVHLFRALRRLQKELKDLRES